jgi:hypothetical protein
MARLLADENLAIVLDALNRGAAQHGKFTLVEEERVRMVPLP